VSSVPASTPQRAAAAATSIMRKPAAARRNGASNAASPVPATVAITGSAERTGNHAGRVNGAQHAPSTASA
jgi:hypothetical protein